MKIRKSKKELARIINENGGWRDGEFAAQDSNKNIHGARVCFYNNKPCVHGNEWRDGEYGLACDADDCIEGLNAIKNWHQTILSRDEYFHLHPVPDADGWIEWGGAGDVPHNEFVLVDTRHRAGHIEIANRICDMWWDARGIGNDIIAYRLHKPEQANPEFCESVMRSIPEPKAKPTIEQLAADYRSAKDYADRKQQEADSAKADADGALLKLELAGEEIGIIVTPITANKEPELVITDWRDLKVGDELTALRVANVDDAEGKRCVVVKTLDNANGVFVLARFDNGDTWWVREWRFIRRP